MPSPLEPGALQAALDAWRRARSGAGPIGRRLEHHLRIASTNDRARELAASGEPEGTVVLAEEQTRGRGRGERAWHSPAGLGLYLSVILRPHAPASGAPLLGLMAAVAAAEALAAASPEPVRIKWPNDLVVPHGEGSAASLRKLGGILAEARASSDEIRDLVIGIGVNVDHRPGDFPPEFAHRATSLRILNDHPIDRRDLILSLLTALDDWYTLWGDRGDGPVLEHYERAALDLEGRRVRVTDGASVWTGTTAGLSQDGALRVTPDPPHPGAAEPAVSIRFGDVARVEGL
jgi:BirA family transcriptional regulator, biotin operon repressor / biotin---[acetyl-CoA-carboxylase] ligase